MKRKLPDNCSHCQSKSIKVSSCYPNYYFCLDCKDGGPLLVKKEKTVFFDFQKEALEYIKKHKKFRIKIQKNLGKTLT